MVNKDYCPYCKQELINIYQVKWSDADNTATLRGTCPYCEVRWTWKRVFSYFDYGMVGEDFTEDE